MARGVRVEMNGRGVEELLTSPEVRADLRDRAERVLGAARDEAAGFIVTGNYYNGLKIREDTTDRAVVRVVGTAPHSHLVEAAHGTLARALDAGR